MYKQPPRGYLILLALVFGAIFVTVLGALSSVLISQNNRQNEVQARSKTFSAAEAGLEYYRWHLSHFPTDLQNGTGHAGPYTMAFNDPVTGYSYGSYQLSIAGNTSCGQTTSIDITSKGSYYNEPAGSAVTLFARYALPTVALYSYVVNNSVWAGADRTIYGPYHSNGGIRMDGTANAPVTSSLSSWLCTSGFGCNSDTTENGVFGAGPNQNLWSYPTPQVDFSAISANFTSLRTAAQSYGLYLPRYSSGTGVSNASSRGYHLIFNSNGTVTVKTVSSETNVPSIPIDNPSNVTTPQTDYSLINTESNYSSVPAKVTNGTYTIPASCGLIFVEDNVWIEGAIPSKITVVAANVTTSGVNPNILLPGNITYTNATGASGLTAISANDILITPNSPDTMTLNGVFVAQSGAFGRNYYGESSNGHVTCPNSYEPRTTLTIHGTTVSNKRTGTKWVGGCSSGDAGYQTRIDAFDRLLSTNPPPFTPTVSNTYQFVDWRQQ